MKLHELKPAEGSRKKARRVGRGVGSRRGRTSTRGHKGHQSRSGYSYKPGFEGGQMPIQRRLPKFGFKNPFRVEYKVVNLDQLEWIAAEKGQTDIDHEVLEANGIISSLKYPVKALGRGELKSKINLTVNKISASARLAVEAVGGSVTLLETPRAAEPTDDNAAANDDSAA